MVVDEANEKCSCGEGKYWKVMTPADYEMAGIDINALADCSTDTDVSADETNDVNDTSTETNSSTGNETARLL